MAGPPLGVPVPFAQPASGGCGAAQAPGGEAAATALTEEVTMSRLIRLDASGHTTLAEWTAEDADAQQRAIEAFEQERERGMIASVTRPRGDAEVVRELPLEAELVVMRRQIAGG
jgi:hypothetical protein